MLTELVGKLPSSSFYLSFIFLSHSGPASLPHLHLFIMAKALLSSFSFTLCFTLALPLFPSPPSISLPLPSSPALPLSHTIPSSRCLSFTDDLGSHSLSLPFMKLLMLFPRLHPPLVNAPSLVPGYPNLPVARTQVHLE